VACWNGLPAPDDFVRLLDGSGSGTAS